MTISPIIILSLVFLLVWSVTALFAWQQLNQRRRADSHIQSIASAAALQASTVAKRATELNEHFAVKEKVLPFLIAAKDLKTESGEAATGHQKRMQVLLNFLKVHPGTSVDAVETAIEAILKESEHGQP